jgi:hypothetical protein
MKYKKLLLELGIDSLKTDAKRKAAQSAWSNTPEGKETQARRVRFQKSSGYRQRPTKMKNFRMYLENIEKVEELAKKLDCTYTNVLERLIVEHGDKLLK